MSESDASKTNPEILDTYKQFMESIQDDLDQAGLEISIFEAMDSEIVLFCRFKTDDQDQDA